MKPRVLIVDDSEIDNNYLELMIDIESIDVDYTFQLNGFSGLKYLEECSPDEFPHLILVDMNMPLINGFEFVAIYEETYYEKYPNTEIYIISSTRRLSEIEEARKSKGVVDFIEKPILKMHFEQFFLKKINI